MMQIRRCLRKDKKNKQVKQNYIGQNVAKEPLEPHGPQHICSYFTTPLKQVHTRFTALKLKNLYIKPNPIMVGFYFSPSILCETEAPARTRPNVVMKSFVDLNVMYFAPPCASKLSLIRQG